MVRELLERGRRVAVFDLESAITHSELPENCCTFVVDCADPESVQAAVSKVQSSGLRIEGLVIAAGVLRPASLEETSLQDWQATFRVNSTAVFVTLKTIVPEIAKRGGGAVVTIASNAAHTPRTGMVAYAASKASAEMLTRSVGLEFAGRGIRANVVAPGSTNTTMLSDLTGLDEMEQISVAGQAAQFKLGIPLGRIAQPRQIAKTVAFLLSDDADHLTLETITVDGGATLGR